MTQNNLTEAKFAQARRLTQLVRAYRSTILRTMAPPPISQVYALERVPTCPGAQARFSKPLANLNAENGLQIMTKNDLKRVSKRE